MAQNIIYVACTSGLVTAVSFEEPSFKMVWQYEAGAPIFGSLALDHQSGKGQLCVDQASFIYQDLNIDAIFFIPPANTGCAILLYIFMFYVQTCIFFFAGYYTCNMQLFAAW